MPFKYVDVSDVFFLSCLDCLLAVNYAILRTHDFVFFPTFCGMCVVDKNRVSYEVLMWRGTLRCQNVMMQWLSPSAFLHTNCHVLPCGNLAADLWWKWKSMRQGCGKVCSKVATGLLQVCGKYAAGLGQVYMGYEYSWWSLQQTHHHTEWKSMRQC